MPDPGVDRRQSLGGSLAALLVEKLTDTSGGDDGLVALPDGGVVVGDQPPEGELRLNELGQDEIELIHFVTQEVRYTLLLNILAHPVQAPALKELVYLYPDRGQTTIVEHLGRLVEWGFVEKLVIPPGERSRSLPHTFYTVSDLGKEFLEVYGLAEIPEKDLQQDYLTIPKPEEILRYENAPRKPVEVDDGDVDEYKVAQVKQVLGDQRRRSGMGDSSVPDLVDQLMVSLGRSVKAVVPSLPNPFVGGAVSIMSGWDSADSRNVEDMESDSRDDLEDKEEVSV